MSCPSQQQASEHPTSNGSPILTARSSSNFYVTPMGKGRPARIVENKKGEEEDDGVAGMGFSILGSVIGGALGLGPMFEIAFEAVKTGLEIGEGQLSSANVVEDINLNPAALLDPSRSFNFKSLSAKSQGPEANKDKEDEDKPKRSWNSGEGDYMLTQRLASKRRLALATNPVMQMKGFGSSSSTRK
jgi:hypothetical protein